MMVPKRCKRAAIVLSSILLSSAQTAHRSHVTGFFTDMHYIEEAGDVLGTEVWIVYARDQYWATVQLAEGAPEPPIVVPVQVSGQRIKFSIRESDKFVLNFDGTVTQAALTGLLGQDRVVLKRHASYWQ